MKILITGGTGFLGSNLAKTLSIQGYKVVTLSRSIPKNKHNYKHYVIDLRDKNKVKTVLQGIDCIVHTAAKTDLWGKKSDYWTTNFEATKNLVDLAQELRIKKFIYTSTPSVIFSMSSIEGLSEDELFYPKVFFSYYAESKAAAESYVLSATNKNFATCALRPHLIWGPGDKHLIPELLKRAKANHLKQIGDGNNKVDLCYIDNAVEAHSLALKCLSYESACCGKAYFVTDQKPIILWDWINDLLKKMSFKKAPKISYKKAYYLAWFCEVIFKAFSLTKNIPMTRFAVAQLAFHHYFSPKAIQKDLAYYPKINNKEGMRKLLAFLKNK